MSIFKSEKHNPNYLAKVIRLEGLRKHPNADRLQIATVDFQQVITGMNAKDGDICVYFPVESVINLDFLAFTNSFREKTLNKDTEQVGFFENKGRVRAVKLRGEKSMGYIVPLKDIETWLWPNGNVGIDVAIGTEFDTIGDTLLVKKYELPVKPQYIREGKKPRISRLVEGQVRLHVDTENLRKNADKIGPEDQITVSYKVHGTSFWVANVLVKTPLTAIKKFIKTIIPFLEFGQATEYDHVYGSRKVVKNEYETAQKEHYFGFDFWEVIKDEIKDKVPKGYTLYGEALGYLPTGAAIQGSYDYGCSAGKYRLQIYRVTVTNADGMVVDLSSAQVQEFCERVGLSCVHVFFSGKAKDMYPEISTQDHWNEEFVKRLEKDYNEKDCFWCVNKVPEEGIVVRKESLFSFESYKLKSFRFLEIETAQLDKGEVDIESAQEPVA